MRTGGSLSSRDKLSFWVNPAGVRVEGGVVKPGAACRIRVGKQRLNLNPGYYVAIGDGDGDDDDPRRWSGFTGTSRPRPPRPSYGR